MTVQPDDVTVSEARDHLADLIGEVTYSGVTRYLTRRGRRVAALVPVDVAEAAAAEEDAWLSELARDARAEIDAGTAPRPFAAVLADLEQLDDDESPLPGQRSSSPAEDPAAGLDARRSG